MLQSAEFVSKPDTDEISYAMRAEYIQSWCLCVNLVASAQVNWNYDSPHLLCDLWRALLSSHLE